MSLVINRLFFLLAASSLLHASSPKKIAKILKKETTSISSEWKKKYYLTLYGEGGSGLNQIETVALSFAGDKEHTVDTARKMVVELGKELLDHINRNQEIKVHLEHYPLSAEHLFLSFSFFEEFDKGPVKPPKLASARISYGKVIYSVQEDSKTPSKTIHEETFEEACQLVAKEK